MPSPMGVSQEPVNNNPMPVNNVVMPNEPSIPDEHFEDYKQLDIKPISNEPSDSSKIKEDYDPLGDFMNKL